MSNRGSFGVTARNGIFSEIRRLVSGRQRPQLPSPKAGNYQQAQDYCGYEQQ